MVGVGKHPNHAAVMCVLARLANRMRSHYERRLGLLCLSCSNISVLCAAAFSTQCQHVLAMSAPLPGSDDGNIADPPRPRPLGVPPLKHSMPDTIIYCEFCHDDIGAYSTCNIHRNGNDHQVCSLCWVIYTITVRARSLPVDHVRRTSFEIQISETMDLLERLLGRGM